MMMKSSLSPFYLVEPSLTGDLAGFIRLVVVFSRGFTALYRIFLSLSLSLSLFDACVYVCVCVCVLATQNQVSTRFSTGSSPSFGSGLGWTECCCFRNIFF